MNLYWKITALFLFLQPLLVSAQPFSLFTIYRENHALINPATINSDYFLYGEHYNLSMGVSHRNDGFLGDTKGDHQFPLSYTARIEYILEPFENNASPRFILGAHGYSDEFGPTRYSTAQLRTGVLLPLREGFFSGAFHWGWGNFRIQTQALLFSEDGFGLDPLANTGIDESYFQMGGGVFFKHRIGRRHDFYVGASMLNVLGLDRTGSSLNTTSSSTGERQFHVVMGSYLFLNEVNFLEPSIWIKTWRSFPPQVDVNIRAQIHHPWPIWIGGGLGNFTDQSLRTIHLELGFQVFDIPGKKISGGKYSRRKGKSFLKFGIGYDRFLSDVASHGGANAIEFHLTLLPGKKSP